MLRGGFDASDVTGCFWFLVARFWLLIKQKQATRNKQPETKRAFQQPPRNIS